MTDPTHADIDRRIAKAMGYVRISPDGSDAQWRAPNGDVYHLPPFFTADANAALEAAAELLPVDFQLFYAGLDNLWYARIAAVEDTDHMEHHVWNADTPALALSKMIVAWLDEQEKQDATV
jgi:hypothetical protein